MGRGYKSRDERLVSIQGPSCRLGSEARLEMREGDVREDDSKGEEEREG